MTIEEFESFVSKDNIEWGEDEENFYFRNLDLAWYANDHDRAVKVLKPKMSSLSVTKLEEEINKGLKIEQISRVTGSFAKVNSWNPGKRAELKDRYKEGFK